MSETFTYLSVIDLFDGQQYSNLRKSNAYSNVRKLTGWWWNPTVYENPRTIIFKLVLWIGDKITNTDTRYNVHYITQVTIE